MSGIFQGYTNSNGRVRASQVTKVPAGSANDRGMIVAGNRVIPYLLDGGQPRTLHDGIAFDNVTGLLLAAESPFGPTNISMGGLLVDSRGAVMLTNGTPQVIHQGVGLQNNGRLSIESEPIATFIAHLGENVASTTGPGTFTRASDGLYRGVDGVWRVAGPNEPRFEDSQLLMEPAITNKNTNYNVAPDLAQTGLQLSGGGTLSRVEDAPSELSVVGNKRCWEVDGTAGTTALEFLGGTGGATQHTFSAWVKLVSKNGSDPFIRLGSAGDLQTFDNTDWQRISLTTTPTGAVLARLQCPTGVVARIVANQLEELPVPSSLIITQGASASRAADALTYANADQFFNQAQGMALITMRPGFDKADLATVEGLLTVSSAIKANLMYFDTAFRSTDGVNTASVNTPAYVEQDELRVAVVYGPTGAGNLQVGYSFNGAAWAWSTAVAYDGGFATDDILAIVTGVGIPMKVSSVFLYDENRGTAWIEANYP